MKIPEYTITSSSILKDVTSSFGDLTTLGDVWIDMSMSYLTIKSADEWQFKPVVIGSPVSSAWNIETSVRKVPNTSVKIETKYGSGWSSNEKHHHVFLKYTRTT